MIMDIILMINNDNGYTDTTECHFVHLYALALKMQKYILNLYS
jgi:hypothetical protein